LAQVRSFSFVLKSQQRFAPNCRSWDVAHQLLVHALSPPASDVRRAAGSSTTLAARIATQEVLTVALALLREEFPSASTAR